MGAEELDRIVHIHREHVADALVPPEHRERLAVESPAPADVAEDLHVGQEAHLDRLDALALAGFAAAACRVEGEAARGVAAQPRLSGGGIDAPDVVP